MIVANNGTNLFYYRDIEKKIAAKNVKVSKGFKIGHRVILIKVKSYFGSR